MNERKVKGIEKKLKICQGCGNETECEYMTLDEETYCCECEQIEVEKRCEACQREYGESIIDLLT